MAVSDGTVQFLQWVVFVGLLSLNGVYSQICKEQYGETPSIHMCVDHSSITGNPGQVIYLDSSGAPKLTNVECKCKLEFSATTSVTISYRAQNDHASGCGITFRLENSIEQEEWGCQTTNITYTISQKENNMTYIKNNSDVPNWYSCLGIKAASNQVSLSVTCYAARTIYGPNDIVNGGWATWNSWSPCSASCGNGSRSRTRTCSDPEPMNGGLPCQGSDNETESCSLQACTVNGMWGTWSVWGLCSQSCGGGKQLRTRECDSPAPLNGGQTCAGNSTETRSCNIQTCSADGMWGEWSVWGSCSQTCGGGTQERTRKCDNPAPQNGGLECSDNSTDTQQCNMPACPVHGGWTSWSPWSSCTVSCGGGGTRTRSRTCTNPQPVYGGLDCSGDDSENETCGAIACPGWSEWSSWFPCSYSCGSGIQYRRRTCDSPSPQYGGEDCEGNLTDSRMCSLNACPINGAWGTWNSWESCSATCGFGIQYRSRTCDSPLPQYGGETCVGNRTDSRICNINACPVNGAWGTWNSWGSCSTTCGEGERLRGRSCDSPQPQNGGSVCTGDALQYQACLMDFCPVNGNWGPWSPWSSCSKTCGDGIVSRKRECNAPMPQNEGEFCQGSSEDTELCNIKPCPVAGNWGPWSPWSICSISCGTGTVSRIRFCDNPEPEIGGLDCEGNSDEGKICMKDECPIDGGFGPWSPWSLCSQTCGIGLQSRRRVCDNPVPQNGGRNCTDLYTETVVCNSNKCPADSVSPSTPSTSSTSAKGPATQAVIDVAVASSNLGAIIGGVIGGLLFLLLLILLIICLVRRRRRKKETERRPSLGPRSVRYLSSGDDVTVTENELYNYDGETPSHAVNALFVGGIPETPSSPGYIPHFSTDTGDRYAVIVDSTKTKHKGKDRPKLDTFAPVKRDAHTSNGDVRASTDTVKLAENYSDDNLGGGVENPGYDGNYLAPYDERGPKSSSSSTSPYDYIDSEKLRRDDEEFENMTGDYARLPEHIETDNPDNFPSDKTDEPDSERYKRFINSDSEESPSGGYLTSPKRDAKFEFPDVQ